MIQYWCGCCAFTSIFYLSIPEHRLWNPKDFRYIGGVVTINGLGDFGISSELHLIIYVTVYTVYFKHVRISSLHLEIKLKLLALSSFGLCAFMGSDSAIGCLWEIRA